MSDVALLASGSVRIGRGAAVTASKQGRGLVANTGSGATVIERGAQVPGVFAVGPVHVATDARIAGDVRGASSVKVSAGASITGQASEQTLLLPLVEKSWTAHLPGPGKAAVANDQTQRLEPGAYGAVTVRNGSRLQLPRGDYFMDSLSVEQGGQLEYEGNEYWPTVVYVSGAVVMKGRVGKQKGGAGFLLIAHRTQQVTIGNFFAGNLVAARARLVLGGKGITVRGGFIAHDIDVLPGTIVEPSPFALPTFQFKGWVDHNDDDRDRVPDYRDGCPADPKKRAPGACGCGIPDDDQDKDGIPDCLARFRREDLATCPSGKACPPAPACRPFAWRESVYWFCTDQSDKAGWSQIAAASLCDKAGLTLARFESPEQGRFLSRMLSAPAWIGSRPGTKTCQVLDSSDGTVIEAECATRLGFVCESRPPLPSPAATKIVQVDDRPCLTAAAAGFAQAPENALESLKRQIADAKAGRLAGVAARPPAAGAVGVGAAPASIACDEVLLCARQDPWRASWGMDAGGPRVVSAAELFPSGRPNLAWSTEYRDPPLGAGAGHSWCRMATQDPASLVPVALPGLGRAVQGHIEGLSVTLKPDVSFRADPVPYPFGEVEPNLREKLAFEVSAEANGFLGIQAPMALLSGTVEIVATRCGLHAGITDLRALGDASPRPPYIPWIDSNDPSSPLHDKAVACEQALRRFLHYADYAKKSFRDAQHLLWQLRQAKGPLNEEPLCKSIEAAKPLVAGFPGGAQCYANEPTEAIANRFAYFYNPTGIGIAAGLQRVAHAFWNASAAFAGAAEAAMNRGFVGETREAHRTVATIPLTVGSIPVKADIDLAVRYAISGAFQSEWKFPLWLEGPPQGTDRLLRVAATIAPTVSASLSLSLAVDPAYAGLGITAEPSGVVTLANATLPLFVEAALDREAFLDDRPLPADIREPVALKDNDFVFGAPKRYRFTLAHEHGAGVDGTVLSGELNAGVRVPMGSFARVFKAPIATLQGESGHFDLADAHEPSGQRVWRRSVPGANGDSSSAVTRVVAGAEPVGISEAELPLMALEGIPDGGGSRYGAAPVDMHALERVFYDDLCRPKPGEPCLVGDRRAPSCEEYSTCEVPEGKTQGLCKAHCRSKEQACWQNQDCCQGLVCDSYYRECEPCVGLGQSCRESAQCCAGLTCDKARRTCAPAGR